MKSMNPGKKKNSKCQDQFFSGREINVPQPSQKPQSCGRILVDVQPELLNCSAVGNGSCVVPLEPRGCSAAGALGYCAAICAESQQLLI